MAEIEEEPGIEVKIEHAVCSRLPHFKEKADSLTLESVRRLLEKDLGLAKFALDAHKRFIRQYLEKQMDAADDSDSKTACDVDNNHIGDKEATPLTMHLETKKESTKSTTEDKEMMEDSPILGVLSPESEAGARGLSVSKSMIKKAIWERSDHFRANSENITLIGVRRLLEEDLGMDKNTLDPFRKYISQEIDQVLNLPKDTQSVKDVKKNVKSSRSKNSGSISNKEDSDSSDGRSDKVKDKVKSSNKAAHAKNKKHEEPKKRKRSKEGDFDVSSKKHNKVAKRHKEEDSESDDIGNASEDGQSKSSREEPTKEKSAPGYGRRVEHLKSVIKACGMSVAPLIYKKARQVPDERREAFFIKELEAVLSKEGLSKDPSEKEIKDCRKRKETAKELEGIDMSNIISSTRRRSTFSFIAPKLETSARGHKVGAKDVKTKEKINIDHNDDNGAEVENKKVQEKVEEKIEDKEPLEEEEEKEEAEEEEVDEDDDSDEEAEEDESEEFNEEDNEESE